MVANNICLHLSTYHWFIAQSIRSDWFYLVILVPVGQVGTRWSWWFQRIRLVLAGHDGTSWSDWFKLDMMVKVDQAGTIWSC